MEAGGVKHTADKKRNPHRVHTAMMLQIAPQNKENDQSENGQMQMLTDLD